MDRETLATKQMLYENVLSLKKSDVHICID